MKSVLSACAAVVFISCTSQQSSELAATEVDSFSLDAVGEGPSLRFVAKLKGKSGSKAGDLEAQLQRLNGQASETGRIVILNHELRENDIGKRTTLGIEDVLDVSCATQGSGGAEDFDTTYCDVTIKSQSKYYENIENERRFFVATLDSTISEILLNGIASELPVSRTSNFDQGRKVLLDSRLGENAIVLACTKNEYSPFPPPESFRTSVCKLNVSGFTKN